MATCYGSLGTGHEACLRWLEMAGDTICVTHLAQGTGHMKAEQGRWREKSSLSLAVPDSLYHVSERRETGGTSSTNELSKPVEHDKQVMNGLCTLAM